VGRERRALAQPRERPRLTAALAPAGEHALQQLALGDARQHLHAATALGSRPQPHQVQLAGVADPRRAMQRSVDVLAPPQPDVVLA
jgi:hypothetical protein